MTKHARSIVISLAFALLAAGCGLPTYIYLFAPLDFFASSGSSGNQLELDHNVNNYDSSEGSSQSFKGYEIYYRVYNNSIAADNDIDLLSNAASNYEDSPNSFKNYAISSLNFYRLRTVSSNDSPLINISSASVESWFYIWLSDGVTDIDGNGTIEKNWLLNDATNINISSLARNIDVDFSSRSSFCYSSNFQAGDRDYEGADSPASVYCVFFAVAFGSDPISFETVYSSPKIVSNYISFTPGL